MAPARNPHSRLLAIAPVALVLVAVMISATAARATGPTVDELGLSSEARRQLSEHGFVVVPGGSGDFPETYAALAERDLPVFVTSDSVLRVTDLLIDRVLRTIEEVYLYDRLQQLSREMVRLLDDDYLRSKDAMVKDAARHDLAFFAVGLSLLDADYFPPESVRGLVERELELIEDADRVVISPIMGRTPLDQVVGPGEDYTRYVPTGHYASDERLGRYYRALTWYSRMAFALPERPVEDYTLTVQALLIIRALEREAGEALRWNSFVVNEKTLACNRAGFFAGGDAFAEDGEEAAFGQLGHEAGGVDDGSIGNGGLCSGGGVAEPDAEGVSTIHDQQPTVGQVQGVGLVSPTRARPPDSFATGEHLPAGFFKIDAYVLEGSAVQRQRLNPVDDDDHAQFTADLLRHPLAIAGTVQPQGVDQRRTDRPRHQHQAKSQYPFPPR